MFLFSNYSTECPPLYLSSRNSLRRNGITEVIHRRRDFFFLSLSWDPAGCLGGYIITRDFEFIHDLILNFEKKKKENIKNPLPSRVIKKKKKDPLLHIELDVIQIAPLLFNMFLLMWASLSLFSIMDEAKPLKKQLKRNGKLCNKFSLFFHRTNCLMMLDWPDGHPPPPSFQKGCSLSPCRWSS